MIPSRAEIVSSTIGGARLLFFKPDGLGRLSRDSDAPWRSFLVWFLLLPALFLGLEGLRDSAAMEEAGFHFYALWTLCSIVQWLAFPVLLLTVAGHLPLRMRVPLFVQALNWMAFPAQYILLVAGWLSDSRLLPHEIAGALGDIVLLWLLIAEWWLARRILAVSVAQAMLLVLMHFMLDYALTSLAFSRTLLL